MNIINIIIISTVIPCTTIYTCCILCRPQYVEVQSQESYDEQDQEESVDQKKQQEITETQESNTRYNSVLPV